MGTKVYFIGKLKRKIIKDYCVLRSIVDQQTPDQCTVTHNVVINVQPKSITTKDQASNITEWSIFIPNLVSGVFHGSVIPLSVFLQAISILTIL